PQDGRRSAALVAAVILLDLVEVKSACDDEAELVDVYRLLVKVVGSHCDGLDRAFTRAVTCSDDYLGIRLQPQDFGQCGKTFIGAIWIGWQAEVERDDRGLVRVKAFVTPR